MHTVFVLLFFFQNADYAPAMKASADTQRRESELRTVASASTRPVPSVAEENTKQYAAARDQAFVDKFNKLVNSLMEFSDTYKDRQAMDVKKAQAIRKAWLELEKSEPVFQEK